MPEHIADTVRVTAKLRADHREAATRLQVAIEQAVHRIAHPGFIGLLISGVLGWVGANLLAPALGIRPIDRPPFAWLGLATAVLALVMTVLILATQRRDDMLAQRRERMMLELAILSEQKLAKIIQLLEESRRDNPLLDNRVDASAAAMETPADPHTLG